MSRRSASRRRFGRGPLGPLARRKTFWRGAANFAYHANALGARPTSSVVSAPIRWAMKSSTGWMPLALSRDYVAVDPRTPRAPCRSSLDAGGRPTYVIHENVAWDFLRPGPAMLGLAAAADAVCFGSLAQRVGRFAGDDLRFSGRHRPDCLRIFDINLRQHYFDVDTIAASLSWRPC